MRYCLCLVALGVLVACGDADAESASDVVGDGFIDVATDLGSDTAATPDPGGDTLPAADTDSTADAVADVNVDVVAAHDADAVAPIDAVIDALTDAAADVSADTGPSTDIPPCSGAACPIVIGSFPFHDIGDTSVSVIDQFDSYSCGAQDESGPEVLYVFELDEPGTVVAMVTDGSDVDIDLHLLTALEDDACLIRNDKGVSWRLEPGVYYIAADTWVSGGGTQFPGSYELFAHFIPDWSVCAMDGASIPRIGTTELLPMPATGPVVKEAHLVTAEEDAANLFPSGWPTSIEDGILNHYTISQDASGFLAERSEPWAPCCEPSNEFGQGSSVKPPAAAEAWYVNMRWKTKPPSGQRYIVFNGLTGEAVVAAAGYENGPGNLSRIGGAAEEIHIVLDTGHLDPLTFGVALAGDALDYGPIDCSAAAP